MTYHDKRGLAALKAAGHHLRTKDAGDPFDLLSKKFGDLTDVTVKRLDDMGDGLEKVTDRLAEMEKRNARLSARKDGPGTWGREFLEAKGAEIKDLAETNSGKVQLNVKSTLTTGPASAGALDVPMRDSTVLMPRRRLTIRSLMNVLGTSSGTVEYANQTTRPGGAATVAEGTEKPESDLDFELKTTSAKVVAHWIKASRQILEDAPQLRDLIDTEMRYGLALEEEDQLLNGNGTGSNLSGMIPNATAYLDPLTMASPDMIDTIGTAVLQTALTDVMPDGVILHPSDWWKMRLLKDADGKYILGNPQAEVQPSLFGLPVVATQAIAAGDFLVGSFSTAATLYDRWQPRVEVGYVNDDFTKNLVTILAEERIALAIKQPLGLTHGSFPV